MNAASVSSATTRALTRFRSPLIAWRSLCRRLSLHPALHFELVAHRVPAPEDLPSGRNQPSLPRFRLGFPAI